MASRLKGELRVPGDKSISHRALIFSAPARGECSIGGLSPAEDCLSTARCLSQLGISSRPGGGNGSLLVNSPGLDGLGQPGSVMDAGNSGTTMRLLTGLISGQPFEALLDGDDSLRRRPMSRVIDPLRQMGAQFWYSDTEGFAPYTVKGGRLSGINFDTPLASAQVQTCILLAGLQADGETSVKVPPTVRDHTSRLFQYIGVPVNRTETGAIAVSRLSKPVSPFSVTVPADISSAAFFIVGATCLPGSEVILKEVGLNPGRRLIIDVLLNMGADIRVQNQRELTGEPVADITVAYNGRLKGVSTGGTDLAAGIDEIPILALAGCLSDGFFSVTGASELRHKESDRLKAITDNFLRAGAQIEESDDGFNIQGQETLAGGSLWNTYGDHRLAMTGLITNLVCRQPLSIDDIDCARISYPSFVQDLNSLTS